MLKLLSKEMFDDYIGGSFTVLYFIFGFVPHLNPAYPFVRYLHTTYQSGMLGQGGECTQKYKTVNESLTQLAKISFEDSSSMHNHTEFICGFCSVFV